MPHQQQQPSQSVRHEKDAYDSIVVGSGISGLTMACLLGMGGQKVLLLEKAPRIGGSMGRFLVDGIPFDTGFHFTGGFSCGGILLDMLKVLGVAEKIKPSFLPAETATRFVIEDAGRIFDLPTGTDALMARLKEYFPSECRGIDAYFAMVTDVCRRTCSMDLRKPALDSDVLREDRVSLQDVLDGLTSNPLLKSLLSAWCMCHGVRPAEVSFANHARVASGLYESIARVEEGGDAFVQALRERLDEHSVEIRCETYITKLEDIRERRVCRFVLNSGDEVSARDCVFTIHPQDVMKLLPWPLLHKAFVHRVQSFEPSIGFFSVYGTMEPLESDRASDGTMISLFPTADLNRLLDPAQNGDGGMVILRHLEKDAQGNAHRVVNTFEASFPQHLAQWQDSRIGCRPDGYREYKEKRTRRIVERLEKACPREEGTFHVLDAASVLTFRDYLNSPFGSAYGISQKIGAHSLFGRLPLKNLYIAGQSSVLPGVVGAMMSSFILWRRFMAPERYGAFVNERLAK